MSGTGVDVALVLLFILVGGLFSGSEIALVSLRGSQIEGLRRRGARGERVARLAADPNRFLSAVQVGVTVTGFFSASFGAAALAPALAPALVRLGLGEGAAGTVALVAVTLVVAALSLVLGELAPKRLALQRAEGVSLLAAGPLEVIARALRPVIWLLSTATDGVVRLFGGDPDAGREEIGEDELRSLVREHEGLDPDERRIVSEALDLADKSVRDVLVPRTEVMFLQSEQSVGQALDAAVDRPHSRYPVSRDDADDVVGFVHVRDLYGAVRRGRADEPLAAVLRTVPFLPESLPVLTAMSVMRKAAVHLAVVVDEYGGTAGIVTLEDLVEEVLGDIRDEYDDEPTPGPASPAGTVDLDGLTHVDDVRDHVPGLDLGAEHAGDGYETLAGFVLASLHRIPEVGDRVEVGGHELVVARMDGLRVARVHVRATATLAAPRDEREATG